MRPVSLHLAGFTAFRRATDIDFEGADLFALTGPTGSGKSSIIDAICFALYGSIPRLAGVAPVVSLGKPEARIRLVFEVEGETYTVSRLIVRAGDGASQRDVRFEGPGFVVEGVREVDARIARLLGLGFDHFTRCVVLPQGRFAAFLEDGPAAREKLLKQLLDLGVYEEMRKRGASHATRLEGEIAGLDAQLHDLLVDSAQVADTEARLERLGSLRDQVVESLAVDEEVTASLRELGQARAQVVGDIARLEALQPPPDLADLADELRDARSAVETARGELAELEKSTSRLDEQRAALGELSALDRAIEGHARVVELRERLARGSEVVAATKAKCDEAAVSLAEAESQVEAAVSLLAAAKRDHAAHALRIGLVDGDDCPVCLRPIESMPSEQRPADLERALAAVTDATAVRDDRAARLAEVKAELAKFEAHLEQRSDELTAAEAVVAGLAPLGELTEQRTKVVSLDSELEAMRRRLAAARQEVDSTAGRLERAEKAGAAAVMALDLARDTLAGLEPPVPGRTDPGEDWAVLVEWSRARRADFEERRVALEAEVFRLQGRAEEIRSSLAAAAAGAGLAAPGDDLRVAVASAIAAAETTLTRMRSDLEKKQTLQERRRSIDTERIRYDETAKLLRSNRFQQWLLEEALVGLVEFANAELAKLAGGAYSLAVDGGEFEVIDHRNAEARRSVKTLSGGETFLVSLALALALAERVVATSAIGTARIESMFLDEGFGTLDAETLDTVASVVQELGSRDRMVGIVTHVRELADQIPTRYEVRKLPDGATVTRVDG